MRQEKKKRKKTIQNHPSIFLPLVVFVNVNAFIPIFFTYLARGNSCFYFRFRCVSAVARGLRCFFFLLAVSVTTGSSIGVGGIGGSGPLLARVTVPAGGAVVVLGLLIPLVVIPARAARLVVVRVVPVVVDDDVLALALALAADSAEASHFVETAGRVGGGLRERIRKKKKK